MQLLIQKNQKNPWNTSKFPSFSPSLFLSLYVSFSLQYSVVGWPLPHPRPMVWAGRPSQTCPAEYLMTGCLWSSCVLFVRGSPPLLSLTVSPLWTCRALLCFTCLFGAGVGPRRACTHLCLFWEHLLTVPSRCQTHFFFLGCSLTFVGGPRVQRPARIWFHLFGHLLIKTTQSHTRAWSNSFPFSLLCTVCFFCVIATCYSVTSGYFF